MNASEKKQFNSLALPRLSPDPLVFEPASIKMPPEHLFGLLSPDPHEHLLLSGGQHPLSCHSFIGLDPFLTVTAYGKKIIITYIPSQREEQISADPFEFLRYLLQRYRLDPKEGYPPFWSGGIGYLGYELGRHIEKLPATATDDLLLPELYFTFYRSILCYNHARKTYCLYTRTLTDNANTSEEPDKAATYRRIESWKNIDYKETARRRSSFPLKLQSHFSQSDYIDTILRALNYIEEGDIYQVNLSQRFHTLYDGDPYGLFLKLHQINPAPFFAYLNAGPFQIVCSSPERFLYVKGREIETRPIKGTLPRGSSPEEDQANAQALLKSEKNRAELAMIIDLLRNDLGRVSAYGSVCVEDPARLETYTNVFHLVSVIKGTLASNADGIDLLRATFPGGSITGCPKIRSMEIIDELEPTVRSVYTGAIGYLCWDGTMDLNIAIRTLIHKGRDLYCQVGGGIVYDSDPLSEFEETLHKAASIKEALASTVGTMNKK